MDLTSRAISLAWLAHHGQRDKAGRPYIDHLMRVASSVDPQDRAVAWLHDVLEDTPVAPADLNAFGFDLATVADLQALTRYDDETYAEFIERVSNASDRARRVKIADLRDHLRDPDAITPSLVRRYERALARLDN